MLWAWIITGLCSTCTAIPFASTRSSSQGGSFLASAWRASRAGLAEVWQLERQGNPVPAPAPVAAPAAAPVPAPLPPRPSPFPPKFPVIGQDECDLFQDAFLVSPGAKCSHAIFAENVDGCTCQIVLPASIQPQPANFYNPFLVDIPPNPDLPTVGAMPTVPPPSNPMQPFVAPMMPPECPFVAACASPDDFNCVGYNSWGFGEAAMAGYTPAAAALNSVSCSYWMKPYAKFKVPHRVAALWHLNAKTVKVFDRMSDSITMYCTGRNITTASMQEFCKTMINKRKFPCDTEWKDLSKATAQICEKALPPEGFDFDSTIAELCPLECGWKPGVTKWPPFFTTKEVKKMREEEKKKKEEEEAKKKAEEEAEKEKIKKEKEEMEEKEKDEEKKDEEKKDDKKKKKEE